MNDATTDSATCAGVVVALIAGFCGVALYYAGASYLNPDEATFYPSIAARDLNDAYVAARRHPHPPLWPMLLSLIASFADATFALRCASVLAAGLGVWCCYRWVALLAGATAALCAAAVLTSSFALLAIATEVRPYAGLFVFQCAALWAAEVFVRRPSARALAALTAALCASVLSHYATIFVAAALGVYVFGRLWMTPSHRRWLLPWLATQMGWAAIAAWALLIHGAQHSRRVTAGETLWWVRHGVWGRESLLSFLGRMVLGIGEQLESYPPLGAALLLFFSAGCVALWRRRSEGGRWQTALLSAPFLISLAAAAAGIYPSGHARHVNFLLPFAAAGAGIGATVLLREHTKLAAGVALAVTASSLALRVPNNNPEVYDPDDVRAAVAYLRQEVPRGAMFFIDGQSGNAISYYLRDHGTRVTRWSGRGRPRFDLIGLSFVAVRPPQWELSARSLRTTVPGTARRYGFRAPDDIWVLSTGWNNKHSLVLGLPEHQLIEHRRFGRIQIVHMRLAPARRRR